MHSTRQIEIVATLAEHRHFGLAAEALGVSQPALTRSLKQIESGLGVRLFDRRGVTPTFFGEIVLKHGQRALAEFDGLMHELALAKGLDIGELRIAAAPYPADISAERAVGVLSERRPNIRIDFKVSNWTQIIDEVGRGAIDLGFADLSEASLNPELRVETLRTSRAVFFCRAAHPLLRNEALTIDDLMDYPLAGPTVAERILTALPSDTRRFGFVDENEKRFRPRILVETFASTKRIVLTSLAIGAAIPSQIEPELEQGLCGLLPLEAPWLSLNYGFITKRGRTLSPAAQAFMEIVREIESMIPP